MISRRMKKGTPGGRNLFFLPDIPLFPLQICAYPAFMALSPFGIGLSGIIL